MSTLPQDIADIIAPQHEHVKALLDRVRQATGQARADAFHALRLTLAVHETAEEQAIHPQALRELGDYDRAANDRIAEEQTAAQTIRALEMVDVDSDQFNYSFEGFAASVVDHATAEENDEWPALRHITDVATVSKMAEQMRAVPELADDPTAPGMTATFEDMRQWAKMSLPRPPEPQLRTVASASEQAAPEPPEPPEPPIDPPPSVVRAAADRQVPNLLVAEKAMIKLLYKPVSMLVSVLGGILAGVIFKRVWKVIGREDEAPKATDKRRGWREVLLAAALQGAIFAVVKAAVDRSAAEGTRKVTGVWPGEHGED
jgi:hemerythrin superfamily protein